MAAEVPKVEGPLKFEFRLSSNTSGEGVVFWRAKGQPFHRSRTQSIAITHDAAFKNYAIDIEPAAPLAGLRLDSRQRARGNPHRGDTPQRRPGKNAQGMDLPAVKSEAPFRVQCSDRLMSDLVQVFR